MERSKCWDLGKGKYNGYPQTKWTITMVTNHLLSGMIQKKYLWELTEKKITTSKPSSG